ncbi:hypothetical protein PHISP_03602 [Aspergillus sp. HF37]|nr:hypothetical protein PHISP_03602 [Aspergillus sp. HF37]
MTALILLAILLHVGFSLSKTTTVRAAPNGSPTFVPSSVTAEKGDTVKFEFYPRNHTVTESSYSSPCVPNDSGINSGFIPAIGGEASEHFLVPINNTDPIWYYCAQARHCQAGMVGVINPPNGSSMTLEKYSSAAASAPSNVAPTSGVLGGTITSDETTGSGTPTASSTSTTSATATGAASTLSPVDPVLGLLAASSWWLL